MLIDCLVGHGTTVCESRYNVMDNVLETLLIDERDFNADMSDSDSQSSDEYCPNSEESLSSENSSSDTDMEVALSDDQVQNFGQGTLLLGLFVSKCL
jgi:hypothetical protein